MSIWGLSSYDIIKKTIFATKGVDNNIILYLQLPLLQYFLASLDKWTHFFNASLYTCTY